MRTAIYPISGRDSIGFWTAVIRLSLYNHWRVGEADTFPRKEAINHILLGPTNLAGKVVVCPIRNARGWKNEAGSALWNNRQISPVIRSIDKQSYPVTDGQNLHLSFFSFPLSPPFTLSASSRSLDSSSQISTEVHPANTAPATFRWCIFHDASGSARLVASYHYRWIRHSGFFIAWTWAGILCSWQRYRLTTLHGQFDSNFGQCASIFQRLPKKEKDICAERA